MKRIGILAEDLAGGCLVTVDYSKKAGFPRIAKCIYSVSPCHQKSVGTQSFNALFFLPIGENAGLSVGGPLTYYPLLFLDKHERSYWVEVS